MLENSLIPFDDELWLQRLDEKKSAVEFELPQLRREAAHGVFMWWPDGKKPEDWIHPDDLEIAQTLIPSNRVFRKVDLDDDYSEIQYGSIRIRILPVIWLEIPGEDYLIGDCVEVTSRFGRARPFVGEIAAVLWNHLDRKIEYRLTHQGRELRKPFTSDQFRMVADIDGEMDWRKRRLIEQSRFN